MYLTSKYGKLKNNQGFYLQMIYLAVQTKFDIFDEKDDFPHKIFFFGSRMICSRVDAFVIMSHNL